MEGHILLGWDPDLVFLPTPHPCLGSYFQRVVLPFSQWPCSLCSQVEEVGDVGHQRQGVGLDKAEIPESSSLGERLA